jgi:hypothetical protein
MKNSDIRDVNPTTKRLVERLLAGDWCVQLRRVQPTLDEGRGSPVSESSTISPSHPEFGGTASAQLARTNSKTLKSSRSAENIKTRQRPPRPPGSPLGNVRRPSTSSIANASIPEPVPPLPAPKRKGTAGSVMVEGHFGDRHHQHSHIEPLQYHQLIPPIMHSSTKIAPLTHPNSGSQPHNEVQLPPQRRSAPPPPPKRRKPPAIPVVQSNSGTTFQTIRTSVTSPLAKAIPKLPNN